MSKLINISAQISQLNKQLKIINRLRYKLSSQMRDFKQFKRMRMIVVKIKKLIQKIEILEKYDVKEIDQFNLIQQMEDCNNLKDFIENQGHLLKEFLQRAFLLQFTVIAYSGCAKFHNLIDKILKKMQVIDRIQKERSIKKDKSIKKTENIDKKL